MSKDACLEVIHRLPDHSTDKPHVLFVHGAFGGAWMWDLFFLPYFARHGYPAHALSLRGHGQSYGRQLLDHWSINDYAEDVEMALQDIKGPVVLVGHSMGGFIVQKYLERHTAKGAVLMCSVPPQGLMSSTWHVFMSNPSLLMDLHRLMSGGYVGPDTLKEALFAKPVSDDFLMHCLSHMERESQRAIWDMSFYNLVMPARLGGIPLRVMGAECDALIPVPAIHATARSYGVEADIYPGFGHGFMAEPGWEAIAQDTMRWIEGIDQLP